MSRRHGSRFIFPMCGMILSAALAGCGEDGSAPLAPTADPSFAAEAAAPAALVTIGAGGGSLTLWPYTGADFSGTPQDPINLVFVGKADPRAIRSALFSLSGDRTAFGFPDVAPFNCTWSDAIGDIQTGYNDAERWVGSAIQLACGDFAPVRFHVRLFEAGLATVGNAHFEVLIPGTTDHQVLSWELAEQLVAVDMVRSGLLGAPPGTTGVINAAPAFRDIPAVIYNGLPEELKSAFGGPPGSVSTPVGIGTDGAATVFELAQAVPPATGATDQRFVVQFNQVIPRPFCSTGPTDFLFAQGPVELHKQVHLNPNGVLTSEFHAGGRLQLTPVDPATGQPTGPSYEAQVVDQQTARYDDRGGEVNWLQMQMELPQGAPNRGRKTVELMVGPGHLTRFRSDIDCHR